MNGVQFLAVTNRPSDLVSRNDEMAIIKRAVFDQGDACRIVLVKGDGGLGKTRVLEEVLRCLGDKNLREIYGTPAEENDWTIGGDVPIAATFIDFTDIKLHTTHYFMNQLADSSTWGRRFRFKNYDLAQDRLQRLADVGSAYSLLSDAAEEAERAFWQDYEQAASKQRLVIVLDTIEQLAIISSDWLLKHGLIKPEDLTFNAQQWLLDQIANGRFPNTTLIISGRDREDEGGPYFDLLQKAVDDSEGKCHVIPVKLEPFDLEETRAYLKALHDDWEVFLNNKETEETAHHIRSVLRAVVKDEERLKVLWLYTGGQPIRLSLYTDVLVEGATIPQPLQDSWEEAKKRTQSDGSTETEELLTVRREIEIEFVQILFMANDNLRAQILRTLAQAYNGLTSEEILFALDDDPDINIRDWQVNDKKLKEINEALLSLRQLSIVKLKPQNRIGLQDEMYRIYAEVMSTDPQTKKTERESRQRMYQRLGELVNYRLQKLSQEDEQLIRNDINRIRVERPANVLNTRMPHLSEVAEQKRRKIADDMFNAELDFLHFALLLNPEVNFNDVYYKMANSTVKALDETQLSMLTAELWRVLQNKYAFRFIELQPRGNGTEQTELFEILHRAAQVVDAASWIIRYILRNNYRKAVEFADELEQVIAGLDDPRERYSWNHTLSRGERVCWREYAKILDGENIQKSIELLNKSTKDLTLLSQAGFKTVVFPKRGKNGERGFVGHPALNRLLFIIGLSYNFLGYGYTTIGDFDQAIEQYTSGLKYFRRLSISANPDIQEATTRNNLARALVEMGKGRSVRVCKDALELRIKIGDWLPIAYAFNTLGLIFNDLYRPREALDACANAYAIAQRFENPRVIGLVLIQLSEALRRIARLDLHTRQDSQTEIYSEAERAIQQAREIFSGSAASQESVRLVEIDIETGCLYRDWLALTDKYQSREIWESRFEDARYYLEEAFRAATKLNNPRLALDAQVNIAWTFFAADDFEAAERALQKAEQLVTPAAHFRQNKLPPAPDAHDSYIFKQLSKVMGLYGLIALVQFNERLESLEAKIPGFSPEKRAERRSRVRRDEEMQALLEKAASHYARALGYAQLFAPRSAALTIIYDNLYAFLKILNRRELEDFYKYSRKAAEVYQTDKIKLRNLGNLTEFLLDCFGDYNEPESEVFDVTEEKADL